MKHFRSFYSFLVLLCFAICGTGAVGYADEQGNPSWWNEPSIQTAVQASPQDDVVTQYFYITDTFLAPAYTSPERSSQRDLFFKKAIVAYTKLIEHFTAPGGMSVVCMVQYQIAQSYKELGDIPRAKEAYKKCLGYQKYIKNPPQDEADFKLIAIIESGHKKMEQMK